MTESNHNGSTNGYYSGMPAEPAPRNAPREMLLGLVAMGIAPAAAAHYVGISAGEFERLADDDPGYYSRMIETQRNCEIRYLTQIVKLAEKHWQAAAWFLERTHPDRYGRRGPTVVTAEHVEQALARILDLVLVHVPERERRDRIEADLAKLIDEVLREEE
ncbi:MAG: hypothetical protein K8T25_13880 [Planctomycetia bacterium]|nr:hypothetical protein [Planctomycetia bacterium]